MLNPNPSPNPNSNLDPNPNLNPDPRCARLAVKHVPTEHAPPRLATTNNEEAAGVNESL